MNINEIADRLNFKAIEDGFAIAELPELRKKYLHKSQLPAKIFTSKTVFDSANRYAFHYGGRDEMQFNFGEETSHGKTVSRYGLCFSLEASQSLHDPATVLEPFRKRFNSFVKKYPDLFHEFTMWYFQNGIRYGYFSAQEIPETWFQNGTFICLGKIIEKSLKLLTEDDLTEILTVFDALMPIYKEVVLTRPMVRIFTRLTSNLNNWELPIPHPWKKKDQGKKNIAFENQYGFGHEEWLLNQRYSLDGFQYGSIRGIEKSKKSVEQYDEMHVYTVMKGKQKNHVYYVGKIKNVLVIKNNDAEQKKIQKLVDRFHPDIVTEVTDINGDVQGITKFPLEPNVKFKLKDVSFLDEPLYQPDFNLDKYKRFRAYYLKGPITQIFDLQVDQESGLFVAGKTSQTDTYKRSNKAASVTIQKLHTEITEELERFLQPEYSLTKKNISIETMRFYRNIADIVTQEIDKSISIYEIKTSSSGRRNLRDAIAQLLDYALHSKLVIRELVIVSPCRLQKRELVFLEGLKSKVGFQLSYLCYRKDQKLRFISC